MRLRNGLLLVISCLPFSLASGSIASVVVDKPIDKADECGYVVDQTGLPVSEATLTASAGEFKVSATSSSDGSFLFPSTSSEPMTIEANAKGFSGAHGTIAHLGISGEKKCRHPFYVVLAVGSVDGAGSYLTVSQKDVPKPPKQPKGRMGR
jgi:hypothetical protein